MSKREEEVGAFIYRSPVDPGGEGDAPMPSGFVYRSPVDEERPLSPQVRRREQDPAHAFQQVQSQIDTVKQRAQSSLLRRAANWFFGGQSESSTGEMGSSPVAAGAAPFDPSKVPLAVPPAVASDASSWTHAPAPTLIGPYRGTDEEYRHGGEQFERNLERRSDYLRQSPQMRGLEHLTGSFLNTATAGRLHQIEGALDPHQTAADYLAQEQSMPAETGYDYVGELVGGLAGAMPFIGGENAVARMLGGAEGSTGTVSRFALRDGPLASALRRVGTREGLDLGERTALAALEFAPHRAMEPGALEHPEKLPLGMAGDAVQGAAAELILSPLLARMFGHGHVDEPPVQPHEVPGFAGFSADHRLPQHVSNDEVVDALRRAADLEIEGRADLRAVPRDQSAASLPRRAFEDVDRTEAGFVRRTTDELPPDGSPEGADRALVSRLQDKDHPHIQGTIERVFAPGEKPFLVTETIGGRPSRRFATNAIERASDAAHVGYELGSDLRAAGEERANPMDQHYEPMYQRALSAGPDYDGLTGALEGSTENFTPLYSRAAQWLRDRGRLDTVGDFRRLVEEIQGLREVDPPARRQAFRDLVRDFETADMARRRVSWERTGNASRQASQGGGRDLVATPEPTPHGRPKGDPLPLPPLEEGVDPALIQRAWDIVSARHPRLTGVVRRVRALPEADIAAGTQAAYRPHSRTLYVRAGEELTPATLFHEITHAAQEVRGQIRLGRKSKPDDILRHEAYAYRRGEVFDAAEQARAAQGGEEQVPGVIDNPWEYVGRDADGTRHFETADGQHRAEHPDGTVTSESAPEHAAAERPNRFAWESPVVEHVGKINPEPDLPPEAITQASVKVGDDVFRGANHALAYEAAVEAGALPADFDRWRGERMEEGFTTTRRDFVTREEARAIAEQAKQLREFARKKLDSIDLDGYADRPVRSKWEPPAVEHVGKLEDLTKTEGVAANPGPSPEGVARLAKSDRLRQDEMARRNSLESTATDARRRYAAARERMRDTADQIRRNQAIIRREEINLAKLRERQKHLAATPPSRRPRASVADDAMGTMEQQREVEARNEHSDVDRSARGPVREVNGRLVETFEPAGAVRRPANAPIGAEERKVIEQIDASNLRLREAEAALPDLLTEHRRLVGVTKEEGMALLDAERASAERAGPLPPGARAPVIEPVADAPAATEEARAALDAAVDFANDGPTRPKSSATTTRGQRISDLHGNAYGPIRRLGQMVSEVLPPTRNPEHLLEVAQNSNFVAHEAIREDGIPDPENPGRTLGPSLAYVFEPLGRDPAAVREGIKYALAERILGRGEGAVAHDLEQFENWRQIAEEGRGNRERVEFVNRLDSYMTGLKEYAVKRGLWDREFVDQLDLSDVVYLPLSRVMEGIESTKGARALPGSLAKPHRLHGSARVIQNPVNSLIALTEALVKRADEHVLMNSIVDAIEAQGDAGHQIATRVPEMDARAGIRTKPQARRTAVQRLEAAGWTLEEGQARLLDDLENVTAAADPLNPTVKVRRPSGEVQEWQIHDPFLWSAINTLRPRESGPLGQFFEAFVTGPAKRVFQATHTGLNLRFALGTGPAKDFFAARFLKGEGKFTGKDFAIAWGSSIYDAFGLNHSGNVSSYLVKAGAEADVGSGFVHGQLSEAQFVRELRRAGMGSVSFMSHGEAAGRAARAIAPTTNAQKILHRFEGVTERNLERIERIGMTMDVAPRVAEARAVYRRAIEAGENPRDALQRAVTAGNNVTVNYRDRPASEILQAMGVHVPFFNVALVASNRFGRAMVANPARGALYASALGMAAAVAWAMQKINGTLEGEQGNHPQYRARELAFPLVRADQPGSRGRVTVRLPLDNESAIFAASVTAALNGLWDDDPNAGAVALEAVANLLPPGMSEWVKGDPSIPLPVVQQLQENARNKRFFDGVPIESPSIRDRSVTERRYESTPTTYTGLSRMIRSATGGHVEMSPLELRNVVRGGMLGGFEGIATKLTDPVTNLALGKDGPRVTKEASGQDPLNPASAFTTRPAPSGVFTDQFFSLRERSNQIQADVRAAMKRSNPSDPRSPKVIADTSMVRRALHDQDAFLASDQAKELFDAGTQLAKDARAARDEIETEKRQGRLTSDQARERLDQIQILENRAMRQVVTKLHALRPVGR